MRRLALALVLALSAGVAACPVVSPAFEGAPRVQAVSTNFTGPFVPGATSPVGWIYLDEGPRGLPAAVFVWKDGTWELSEAPKPGWYSLHRARGGISPEGVLLDFPPDAFARARSIWIVGLSGNADGVRFAKSGERVHPSRVWVDDPPPRPSPVPGRASEAWCTPVSGADLRITFRGALPADPSLVGEIDLDGNGHLYIWNDRSWTLAKPDDDGRGLREVARGGIDEDGRVMGLPADASTWRWISQEGWIDATVGGSPLPRATLQRDGNRLRELRAAGATDGALALHFRKGALKGQTLCLRVSSGRWTLRGGGLDATGDVVAGGRLEGLPEQALGGAHRAWEGVPFVPVGQDR